jgi:hypothetical protein
MKISKKKKRLLLIAVPLVLLLAIAGSFLFFGGSANAEVGNLQLFKGTVNVVRDSKTVTGATGTPIEVSDNIKVPSGSTVAIILKDNTIIRLEGGSDVRVAELSYQGGKIKDAVFKLTNGRIWSRVHPIQDGSKFQVETPTITAAVRGTSFNTTFKNTISGIYVYHHGVNVTLQQTGAQQTVNHGQLLQMHQDTLKDDFNKGPLTPPENYIDDWIKFNQAQDDELCSQLHDLPDCDEQTNTNNSSSTQEQTTTQTPTAPTNPNPPSAPKVTKITVTCEDNPVTYSGPRQCMAMATYSDSSTKNVTTASGIAWNVQSADPRNQSATKSTINPTTGVYNPTYSRYGDVVGASYSGETGSVSVDTRNLG